MVYPAIRTCTDLVVESPDMDFNHSHAENSAKSPDFELCPCGLNESMCVHAGCATGSPHHSQTRPVFWE